MTTETIVMLDLTTVTEHMELMIANQITANEVIGFNAGLTLVIICLLTVIMWFTARTR